MRKKPHHPPEVKAYDPPTAPTPVYFGDGPQGFGCADYYVARVPVALARETIINNHYSGRVVNNSYLHLGVYLNGRFVGVLQFGYALNPRRVGHIVEGTEVGQYLELNRMWLSDEAPAIARAGP